MRLDVVSSRSTTVLPGRLRDLRARLRATGLLSHKECVRWLRGDLAFRRTPSEG